MHGTHNVKLIGYVFHNVLYVAHSNYPTYLRNIGSTGSTIQKQGLILIVPNRGPATKSTGSAVDFVVISKLNYFAMLLLIPGLYYREVTVLHLDSCYFLINSV